ncbi:hypothetical protein [Alistipes finegoldii]|uniref:hypothetical protein n=1 Tax=Alistipes finegoldii TaxID=214856 RepID=UPI0024330C80|nr:hypothetical protein [Alistipes finegoldii]
MKIFERITKRYALQNYYLRRNFYWPDTLPEILDYWQQHNELPFLYGGDNWSYVVMCERQRRKGVYASQYLTPDRTARQMAALAVRYFDNDSRIVDACCGTGQLTRALILEGVHPSAILGFDVDAELVDLYERLYPEVAALQMQFHEIDFRCENVIANPPFEIGECTSFLQWLSRTQRSGDRSVLLLPYGFIDKQRPKSVQEMMRHFVGHYWAPMQEPFVCTNYSAEIVVLERA